MSTSYLGLTLPAPNSTQWGTSINTNFEDIDTAYGTLYNQLSSLRLQLGQMGLYYADPQYSGALQFTTSGDAVDSAFITKQADPSTPIYLYQGSSYTDKLNSIVDYTMFVVTLPDNKQSSQFTMGGERWGHNDIAVKMTRFDSTTQRNITALYKMAQSIGGYYRPVQYSWDASRSMPVLTYNRENAVQSSDQHIAPTLYIKPETVVDNRISFSYYTHSATGIEKWLGDAITLSYPQITTEAITSTFTRGSAAGTYVYPTNISTRDYIIIDVFFIYKNQPIILDYTMTELGTYTLNIDISLLPISTTEAIKCRVSYASRD